jgi:hypothetical protein
MAQLYAKKTSDGHLKSLECENTGELRVVVCGKQSDGTITPIRVDSLGRIVLSA